MDVPTEHRRDPRAGQWDGKNGQRTSAHRQQMGGMMKVNFCWNRYGTHGMRAEGESSAEGTERPEMHKELGAAKVRAARTAGAQDLLREAANQGWNLRLSAVVLGWEVPACMTEALQPGAAVPRAFKRSHPRGHQLLGHPGSEEPGAVGASQTQAAP